MARGSRSRASRAERRMQKERAASALERGLPVPTPLPKRATNPASNPRSSSNPARGHSGSLAAARPGQGLPLFVKLLGLGLGLLGLVYGLTLFRDRKSLPDPAALPSNLSNAALK